MEKNYNKLNKKAIVSMYLENIIEIAIFAAILAVLTFFFGEYEVYKKIFSIVKYIYGAYVIISLISPKFRYERYRYMIDDEEIRINEGFIYLKYEIIPIERLHKLTVKQSPIKRIFKLSNITVMTAGGTAEIKYLTTEEAKLISEKLKNKINNSVKKVTDIEKNI